MINKINIVIDGPSASGKSTVGKNIAKKLKFNFLDTGLMYRAFTYYCLKNQINLKNLSDIKNLLNQFNFEFKKNDDIFINDIKIPKKLLVSSLITDNINDITKLEFVRKEMVIIQRLIVRDKKYVVVGRDISTVVLPDAEIKIFLTASLEERAKRRYKELNKDYSVEFNSVLFSLKKRDNSDINRKNSPLKLAKDAILVDNTNISLNETVNKIIHIVNEEHKNNE